MSARAAGIAVSAVLHVALFGALIIDRTILSAAAATLESATPLNMAIFQESTPEPEPEPNPTPKPTPRPKAEELASAAEQAQKDVVITSEQKQSELRYLDRLRAAILKNRVYPRQARRKKQQGTVTVSFHIAPDGSISQIQRSTSSGIDTLDKAAMSAVAGVGQFDAFPEAFIDTSRIITVPISFKLR